MQHVTECHVEPLEGDTPTADLGEARRYTLALAGLGCRNCANRVRNALLRTPGVLEAEIAVPLRSRLSGPGRAATGGS